MKEIKISNSEKIAIVYDQYRLYGETLAMMLEKINAFSFVSCFSNRNESFEFVKGNGDKNLVFFIGYYKHDLFTLNLISDIKRIYPSVSVILLVNMASPDTIKRIVLRKPNAILSVLDGAEQITLSLRQLNLSKIYLSPFIDEIMKDSLKHNSVLTFSDKEQEVLILIYRGKSILESADILNISKHTVIAHRRNMMKRTNCKSVSELLYFSLKMGILRPDQDIEYSVTMHQ